MKIETKFSRGDRVWIAEVEHVKVTCTECKGTKKLKLADGRVIECRACRSNGVTHELVWMVKQDVVDGVFARSDEWRERNGFGDVEVIYRVRKHSEDIPEGDCFSDRAGAGALANRLNSHHDRRVLHEALVASRGKTSRYVHEGPKKRPNRKRRSKKR